jgi:hypothetical protein
MPPGSPDFDAQLVLLLKESGASRQTIDRYAVRLRARAAGSGLPCPFCFTLGRDSILAEQTRIAAILVMRCNTCEKQVLLRTEEP